MHEIKMEADADNCIVDGEDTMFAGVEFEDMHQKTLTVLNYGLMLQHSIE